MNFSIETNRLILRDFLEEDRLTYFQYFKEPDAQNNILKVQSDDRCLQKVFALGLQIAKQRYRRHYLLTIVEKQSLTPIGNCSFLSAITHSREAQIGWHLGSSYRGQGFATETAACLLQLGFEKHLVEVVRADCFPGNFASIRVIQKIGMKPTRSGLILQWVRGYRYGERRPILRYQINKQEWLEKLSSDKS